MRMNAWEMEAAPLFVALVKTSFVGLELVRPSEAREDCNLGPERDSTTLPHSSNFYCISRRFKL